MSADTLQHHLVQPYKSLANKTSEEYKRNYEEWQPIVSELHERLQEATAQGKEKHIKLHKKRGQLLGNEMKKTLTRSIKSSSTNETHQRSSRARQLTFRRRLTVLGTVPARWVWSRRHDVGRLCGRWYWSCLVRFERRLKSCATMVYSYRRLLFALLAELSAWSLQVCLLLMVAPWTKPRHSRVVALVRL